MWTVDLTAACIRRRGANQTATVLLESSIRTKSKTVSYQPTQGTCCTWANTSSMLYCRGNMALDIYSIYIEEYRMNTIFLYHDQGHSKQLVCSDHSSLTLSPLFSSPDNGIYITIQGTFKRYKEYHAIAMLHIWKTCYCHDAMS